MKKDKFKTAVKFLLETGNKFLLETGNGTDNETPFAFFPKELYNEDLYGKKLLNSYAHVGQHSSCHIDYAKKCKKASYAQYQDLLIELIGLGYNLTVLNKQKIEYHRKPTPFELKQGYGAIHYRDFDINECLNSKGGIKKRLKANDGLIYTR